MAYKLKTPLDEQTECYKVKIFFCHLLMVLLAPISFFPLSSLEAMCMDSPNTVYMPPFGFHSKQQWNVCINHWSHSSALRDDQMHLLSCSLSAHTSNVTQGSIKTLLKYATDPSQTLISKPALFHNLYLCFFLFLFIISFFFSLT